MKISHDLSLESAFFWIGGYFGIILFYTAINVGIWRKIFTPYSNWINLATMIILSAAFIWILTKKTGYQLNISNNITFNGIIIAILCAILFYFLLDKCLDPYIENIFPASENEYQNNLLTLSKSPIVTFIHVCILAPIIEEIIMRGFVLGGLQSSVGILASLVISSILFALLHFNMVQILSAFICGIILGMLYLRTGSILCCMIAHCSYNMISYFTTIAPLVEK